MEDAEYIKDFEGLDDEDRDSIPIQFWEEKQRELVTSVVDYNLATLADLVKKNSIDSINLSPKHQRRLRWDNKRQSKLIESFLMNVPVPPIFLNEDSYGQYSVIDGKQRLYTISKFFDNDLTLTGLKIFGDINGKTFSTLPSRFQTVLRTRVTLRSVILLRQSNPKIKYEVFERLNSGGVKLNAQEMRNSVNHGKLNDMILEISENKKFHRLLGIKNKEKSGLYQEMRDAELVLRYFTYRNNLDDFSSKMRITMDAFMENNVSPSDEMLAEMRDDFLKTLDIVDACFGEYSFQRWQPESHRWRKKFLASIYDAQMFACREFSVNEVKAKRETLLIGLKDLFSNKEFRTAIDAATNTPSFFKNRIDLMKKMIRRVVDQ
jgi:hypothetical protein